MGIKLIILLALLIGVLYCIHLLVQDYQALQAPRLLRLLFKRDLTAPALYMKPHVRWRKILENDPVQCARFLFCALGAAPPLTLTTVQQGFIKMLTVEPRKEDSDAHAVYRHAHRLGMVTGDPQHCATTYHLCPFPAPLLFSLVDYLLRST